MLRSSNIATIDFDELKAGLATGAILLVDVRERHEYEAGHIPGSLLMPLSAFDPDALPRDSGKTLILACQAGVRSVTALKKAAAAGRTDITAHYPGGFSEWRAMGEKVETGGA